MAKKRKRRSGGFLGGTLQKVRGKSDWSRLGKGVRQAVSSRKTIVPSKTRWAKSRVKARKSWEKAEDKRVKAVQKQRKQEFKEFKKAAKKYGGGKKIVKLAKDYSEQPVQRRRQGLFW